MHRKLCVRAGLRGGRRGTFQPSKQHLHLWRTLFTRLKDAQECSAVPEEFLQPLFLHCSLSHGSQCVCVVCVCVCVSPSCAVFSVLCLSTKCVCRLPVVVRKHYARGVHRPALNMLPSLLSSPDRKTSTTALLFLRSFLSAAFLALFLSRGSQCVCVCVCFDKCPVCLLLTAGSGFLISFTQCVCVCVCVCTRLDGCIQYRQPLLAWHCVGGGACDHQRYCCSWTAHAVYGVRGV